MRIEQVRLKNFKMFQDVTVKEIQPFTVLVGANGSGKSTFFDVFGFLRDCLRDNVRTALARRGGFREVVTRGHESETILVEVKIKMELSIGSRVVTYRIEIAAPGGRVEVRHELLQYSRKTVGGKPFKFIDFENGTGTAIINEESLFKELLSSFNNVKEKREEQSLVE